MIVLSDINSAPTAGREQDADRARTPAASGSAMTL